MSCLQVQMVQKSDDIGDIFAQATLAFGSGASAVAAPIVAQKCMVRELVGNTVPALVIIP